MTPEETEGAKILENMDADSYNFHVMFNATKKCARCTLEEENTRIVEEQYQKYLKSEKMNNSGKPIKDNSEKGKSI